MKKFKLLLPLIIILLNTGCASFGPTVRIETPEPAEDFVVLCEWYKSGGIISHGGGRSQSDQKIFITKSGEEVDCGLSIWGGSASASWMHPLYRYGDENSEKEIDGVTVIKPVTKLQYLDELKEKFEAGYWDKYKNPGSLYLSNLPGCSGLPYQYLDYYSEARKIDREYFKNKYHEKILACARKEYEEILKHDPYSAKQLPNPEKSMEMLWDPVKWRKYE